MAYECYECRQNSDDPSDYIKEGEPALLVTYIEQNKESIERPICHDCASDFDDDDEEPPIDGDGYDPLDEGSFASGYAEDEWP